METERMGVSAAQLSEPVANSNGISVRIIVTGCLFIYLILIYLTVITLT
jgi:hypothetical protein